MKKDKKWFVDKWTKELNKTNVHDPMYHFITEFITDVNQLDEPESIEETTHLLESVLKENKRLGELLEEKHEEWLELMYEVNNQEKLSQEWIDDNTWNNHYVGKPFVYVEDLKKPFVPKQEVLTDKWIDDNSVYASSDGITEEYVHVDDIRELLVPKQDILSEEWIGENVEYAYFDMLDGSGRLSSATAIIKPEKLKNLLVPKQEDMFNGEKPDEGEVYFAIGLEGVVEISSARSIGEAIERLSEKETNYTVSKKPTIPEFVAEFLVGKEDYMLYDLFDEEWLYNEHDRVAKWLYDNDELTNIEKELSLTLAHRYGYEVEEEQKYVVKIPTNENNDIPYAIVADSGDIWTDALPSKYKLTEEEIRGLTKGDVLFEHFAVKVEELEE